LVRGTRAGVCCIVALRLRVCGAAAICGVEQSRGNRRRLCSANYSMPVPVQSGLEKRQHDVVIRSWDLSCGAAALATLLKCEWGEPATEKEVASGLMGRREYIENQKLV
jgi:hypothetical protein